MDSLLELFCDVDDICNYIEHVCKHWRAEFPNPVSYTRFVEYIPSVFVPPVIYLRYRCLGKCTGISFIDSTAQTVCSNRRRSLAFSA